MGCRSSCLREFYHYWVEPFAMVLSASGQASSLALVYLCDFTKDYHFSLDEGRKSRTSSQGPANQTGYASPDNASMPVAGAQDQNNGLQSKASPQSLVVFCVLSASLFVPALMISMGVWWHNLGQRSDSSLQKLRWGLVPGFFYFIFPQLYSLVRVSLFSWASTRDILGLSLNNFSLAWLVGLLRVIASSVLWLLMLPAWVAVAANSANMIQQNTMPRWAKQFLQKFITLNILINNHLYGHRIFPPSLSSFISSLVTTILLNRSVLAIIKRLWSDAFLGEIFSTIIYCTLPFMVVAQCLFMLRSLWDARANLFDDFSKPRITACEVGVCLKLIISLIKAVRYAASLNYALIGSISLFMTLNSLSLALHPIFYISVGSCAYLTALMFYKRIDTVLIDSIEPVRRGDVDEGLTQVVSADKITL